MRRVLLFINWAFFYLFSMVSRFLVNESGTDEAWAQPYRSSFRCCFMFAALILEFIFEDTLELLAISIDYS